MLYNKDMKTSPTQKKSSKSTPVLKLRPGVKLKSYSPTKQLADEEFISKVIWECLKNNDPDGVIEILEAHFEAVNKLKFSRESTIPRATIYHLFSSKNPTLKTLAKVIHAVA